MDRIVHDEKNINNKIFTDYFGFYDPWFLAKDLYEANQAKDKEIVMLVNDALIDLGNVFNKNTILENENPDKVIYIAKKIINFKKKVKDTKNYLQNKYFKDCQ